MPKVHHFSSTYQAYSASQCFDHIKDGDILVVNDNGERSVAILVEAWPCVFSGEQGAFHQLDGVTWETIDGGKYIISALHAAQL